MFYYIEREKPKLEIHIVLNYTEADLDRVFLFMDAFIDNPKTKVIFKVHPSSKDRFKKNIEDRRWLPLYSYNIKEKIA